MRLINHEGHCCGCLQVDVQGVREPAEIVEKVTTLTTHNPSNIIVPSVVRAAAFHSKTHDVAFRIPLPSQAIAKKVVKLFKKKGWQAAAIKLLKRGAVVMASQKVQSSRNILGAFHPDATITQLSLVLEGNTLRRWYVSYQADWRSPEEGFQRLVSEGREAVLTRSQALMLFPNRTILEEVAIPFYWVNINTGRTLLWCVSKERVIA